jgi:competence protein ComEA
MFSTVFSIVTASLVALLALAPAEADAQPAKASRSSKSAASSSAVVNVNTASAAEFEALPGVGPKLAARIIEYREKHGPFKKVEDLMNVRGLGEKNFLKLKAQLTLAAPKPADRH